MIATLLLLALQKTEVLFNPDGKIQSRIIQEIGSARSEIVAAVFTFTADPIVDALIKAKEKGVAVRVLSDYHQFYDKKGGPVRDALKKLKEAGVEVKLVELGDGEKKDQPHFHHKYAVIDGATVLTGSYNWTQQAEQENHENLVILNGDKKTAAAYVKNFNELWDRKIRGAAVKEVP